MASISTLVDRVKIFVNSSGTGPFVLGSAVPAFRGAEALTDGLTYSYAVESGSNYEAGTGVFVQSVGQLQRTPTISSQGGAPVAFPAGVQIAFTALAQDLLATGGDTALRGQLAVSGGANLVGSEDGASGSKWTTVAGFIARLLSSAGATMVGLANGTVNDAIKYVTPEMFGAIGDGVADDSSAVQTAIDSLTAAGGGRLYAGRRYLVGGITVNSRNITIEGTSAAATMIVKSGTLGFLVPHDWVNFRNLSVISQGDKDDGLNTRGILYTKGTGSIGHVFNYGLIFGVVDSSNPAAPGCFSGRAIEFRNALDTVMTSCLIYKAKTGLFLGRNGTGAADFTTTFDLNNFYVIGCDDYGIDGSYVYRSEWNVIGEFCGTAIRNNIGDLDLTRCYFENNVTLGALLTDTFGHDTEVYSNDPATDAVSRVRGVIGNSDWYTCFIRQGVINAKKFIVQSSWGRDGKTLTGIGTVATIGLKFGEAVIPAVYGNDLLDPSAWASDGTTEFTGWDVVNSGYRVATSLTGIRGIKQSVSLDSAKTYVLQLANKNVSGNPITLAQVDGVAVTPGAPFSVASTGSKLVRIYNSQTGPSENYIQAVCLMEVSEDQALIAKTTDRLIRPPSQRATRYLSVPPTTGVAAVGEIVWNTAPVTSAPIGWVCTVAGAPGTWNPFGMVA